MGDRANCIVLQNSYDQEHPAVWLYTHWGGEELLANVQKAMQRRERWDDDSYLTRIIFDTMTVGQQGDGTGYGITTAETDNGHDFVVVDPNKGEVRIEDPGDREVKHCWPFEQFCTADLTNIEY